MENIESIADKIRQFNEKEIDKGKYILDLGIQLSRTEMAQVADAIYRPKLTAPETKLKGLINPNGYGYFMLDGTEKEISYIVHSNNENKTIVGRSKGEKELKAFGEWLKNYVNMILKF
jgi:hypothetical protein